MPKGKSELYMALIQEVRKRECLYVPTHPHYKDRQKLESEWAEIGRILDISEYLAKKTWQNLRSSYTRCLASEKALSLRGFGRKSSWYLKDQMDFLRDYMSVMPSFDLTNSHNSIEDIGPHEEELTTEELVGRFIKEEEEEDKDQEETSNDMVNSNLMSAHLIHPVVKKRKTSHSSECPVVSLPLNNSLLKCLTSADSDDDDLVFFKGLLPTVKKLSSLNNLKFKQRTANCLFELLQAQVTPDSTPQIPLNTSENAH